MTADEIISVLQLTPHPEGGHYRETWRDEAAESARGHGTAIYYLLRAGERSHWHRVDAAEIWLYHAGAPLELSISEDGVTERPRILGVELLEGQRPQILIPPGAWQGARSLGAWTLVSCAVSPAFEFSGFEMAPEGWAPSGA